MLYTYCFSPHRNSTALPHLSTRSNVSCRKTLCLCPSHISKTANKLIKVNLIWTNLISLREAYMMTFPSHSV